jgi:hypothetical protein
MGQHLVAVSADRYRAILAVGGAVRAIPVSLVLAVCFGLLNACAPMRWVKDRADAIPTQQVCRRLIANVSVQNELAPEAWHVCLFHGGLCSGSSVSHGNL